VNQNIYNANVGARASKHESKKQIKKFRKGTGENSYNLVSRLTAALLRKK
jgi:hypothetical protein